MLNLAERRDAAFRLAGRRLVAAPSRQCRGAAGPQHPLRAPAGRILCCIPAERQSGSQGPRSAAQRIAGGRGVPHAARSGAQPSRLPAEHAARPAGVAFVGGDYTIPGFYTQRGYHKLFVAQGADLVSEILRDNWVLGEGDSLSTKDLGRLLVEMEQLYFRDYAAHWSEAIAQLNILPAGSGAVPRSSPGSPPRTRRCCNCCWRCARTPGSPVWSKRLPGPASWPKQRKAPAASSARQPSWQPPPPSKPRPHC